MVQTLEVVFCIVCKTVVLRANNVFDKHYALAAGYATPRTNVFVGVRVQH